MEAALDLTVDFDENLPVAADDLAIIEDEEMYDGFEVSVPDDVFNLLSEDEPDEIDNILLDIPLEYSQEDESDEQNATVDIRFVPDATVEQRTVFIGRGKNGFVCARCGRSYSRESFFAKHKKICLSDSHVEPVHSCAAESSTADVAIASSGKNSCSITGDDVRSFSKDSFVEIIKNASENAVFSIKIPGLKTPGNIAADVARSIYNATCNENVTIVCEFAEQLFDAIFQLRTERNCTLLKRGDREQLCKRLHNFIYNSQGSWTTFLGTLSIAETSPLLYQSVCRKVLHILVKKENEQIATPQHDVDLKLSDDEQQVIRYVAGYIPFALLKIYKKRKESPAVSSAIELLQSLGAADDPANNAPTFLAYTNQWVEKVDRGGLFKVNDEMFIFVRRIENVARTILNKNLLISYRGEDLRDVMFTEISRSRLVNLSWDSMTRFIENSKLSDQLRAQIIQKWVNIRARAFVKAYIQLVKLKYSKKAQSKKEATAAKGAPAQAGEVSLRKQLK